MGKVEFDPMFIRYTGLFDFDGLYILISDWGKNYGYLMHEREYKHKAAEGAEQEVAWVLSKNVTDYVSFEITIEVHTYDVNEVIVEVGAGKKKPLANGRIQIKMWGVVQTDWQKRFGKTPFTKRLGKWYEAIKDKEIGDAYIEKLNYRTINLHALIKKHLELQTKKHAYKSYLGEN